MSDKKPWEETWIQHPMDYRAVCERTPEDESESLVIADVRADEPEPVSRLISAAPDMARALHACMEYFERTSPADTEVPEYNAVCAALAKAGVIS